MTNEEQKLREFVSKYVNDDNEPTFLPDLTALISEHYYPKEFTEWLDDNLVAIEPDGYNFYDHNGLVVSRKTFDELFAYWKDNEC